MRIDVLARAFGTPAGASNGMAIAAGFLAETLAALGHEVRALTGPDGFDADLVLTTIAPRWLHAVAGATVAGALGRLAYWHHAGGVPEGHGCMLAVPPACAAPRGDWSRQVVLPPSSWAAEVGGTCTGDEILVAGAGPAKGGHVALEVARLRPDLRWFVLRGRSAPSDRNPWRELPGTEVADKVVEPTHLLARARAVLSPTRFEMHPLLLVEAAVRGIPIVCTDMAATRAAAGDSAIYVPMNASAGEWAAALREALEHLRPRLQLRPYAEVASEALEQLAPARRVAA